MKEEEPVHYYNVITGTIACGIDPKQKPGVKMSVFKEEVSCPRCLGSAPEATPVKPKERSS